MLVLSFRGCCVESERQRVLIRLSGDQPRPISRPLRTGRNFVLVVPARRVLACVWDKVDYQPGETASITIVGAGLGEAALPVTVEAEAEDGTWSATALLSAQVAADGKKAVSSWKVPRARTRPGAASVSAVDGSVLSDARFEDSGQLAQDGLVWMLARAPGFDGRCLQVVLERETEPGEWSPVGEAVATVRSGALRTEVDLSHGKAFAQRAKQRADAPVREAEGSQLSGARFEDPLQLKGTGPVWLSARAAGFDGRCVQVVLEQEVGQGDWRAIGQATTTVRAGAVHAAVVPDIDHG